MIKRDSMMVNPGREGKDAPHQGMPAEVHCGNHTTIPKDQMTCTTGRIFRTGKQSALGYRGEQETSQGMKSAVK